MKIFEWQPTQTLISKKIVDQFPVSRNLSINPYSTDLSIPLYNELLTDKWSKYTSDTLTQWTNWKAKVNQMEKNNDKFW